MLKCNYIKSVMEITNYNTSVEKKWYKKWWGVCLIFLILLVVGFAVWFLSLYLDILLKLYQGDTADADNQQESQAQYQMQDIIDVNDPAEGLDDAKLQVVEFGDFRCPVCKKNYYIIRELTFKYPEKIQIIWKDYPVIAEDSVDFALAGECANEQGKFWAFHDKVFQMQDELTLEDFSKVAQQIGVNEQLFNACLKSQEIYSRMQSDFIKGEEVGVAGTPTFIINGYKVQGYIPMEFWEDILESLK